MTQKAGPAHGAVGDGPEVKFGLIVERSGNHWVVTTRGAAHRALVVVEIEDGRIVEIVALKGPAFNATFNDQILPYELGEYWRPTVFGPDLTRLLAPPTLNFDLRGWHVRCRQARTRRTSR